MRPFIIGLLMIIIGLGFGITLTELSLRTFMPELAQKQPEVDTGYIKDAEIKIEATLNEHGFRETDTLADLEPNSWIALGGSTAFGVGVTQDKRFSEQFETLTGLKVYNAAQVGKEGDMAAELEAVKEVVKGWPTKAQKLVYVVDMGLPPHVILQKETTDTNKGDGFLQSLILTQVLTGQTEPAEPTVEAWSAADADNYARKLAKTFVDYRTMNEHFIVLVVPARGHAFDNSFGTIHRNNQKMLTDALRRHQGVYAVDLSFLVKMDYANPDMLYSEQNRLNETGHRMLANGFLKQFETFSTWKSFDELSPEEQEKVREDMRRTEEEEAKKRAQRPF